MFMTPLKLSILAPVALLISTQFAHAQLSNVAVVDFERAVVESAEGKKASEKFNAALQAKQADAEKRRKDLEDAQKKLQNGARTLSDSAKSDLQREIDRKTTELQRVNEDAEKELQTLRDDLLRPIAERATQILQAMGAEKNYTIVVDLSNQEHNVIWYNPKNDITAELIKRIDAATPSAKTEAPKTPAPASGPAPKATQPATQPATPPATPKP